MKFTYSTNTDVEIEIEATNQAEADSILVDRLIELGLLERKDSQ